LTGNRRKSNNKILGLDGHIELMMFFILREDALLSDPRDGVQPEENENRKSCKGWADSPPSCWISIF
jgi:hypothetical protein